LWFAVAHVRVQLRVGIEQYDGTRAKMFALKSHLQILSAPRVEVLWLNQFRYGIEIAGGNHVEHFLITLPP
jgi:hypothetical protein